MPMKPDNPDAGRDVSEEALHWIVRLHSGDAGKDERLEYQKWRAANAEHDKAAAEAEMLWENMSRLHVDSSNGLMRIEPGRKRPSRREFLAGVAVCGAAGTIGAALWTSGSLRRLTADYASATASPRTIELADGSRVFLNARSAIDVKLGAAFRQVFLLEGQAYFEVASDPARPFEVKVDAVSVVALGTAFDVSRSLSDAAAEVAVTEHAVLVRSDSGASARLSAGESVAVRKSGRIGKIRAQDAAVTLAWRYGVYIAEDRPLSDVIAALAAWYPGTILIGDSSLGTLKVNTVLDLKDPAGSLDALQGGLPIRVLHFSNYFAFISKA